MLKDGLISAAVPTASLLLLEIAQETLILTGFQPLIGCKQDLGNIAFVVNAVLEFWTVSVGVEKGFQKQHNRVQDLLHKHCSEESRNHARTALGFMPSESRKSRSAGFLHPANKVTINLCLCVLAGLCMFRQ